MIGLPDSCDYHVTQLHMITCNLLSCLIQLWLRTGQSCHISKSLDIIKLIKVNESSMDRYMRRLLLFKKLLELVTKTRNTDFAGFLKDKKDYFQTRLQSDIDYEKVHQLYTDGHYSQCISEIHESKDCDSFTRDCQTLLLANCHAHNGLYHLALHYYYQSLQSNSTLIHQLAASNVCTVYQIIKNVNAEMKMRQLLLKLLKEDTNHDESSSSKDLLLLRDGDTVVSRRMIGKDYRVATYEYILRSNQVKNYSQASLTMTQLMHTLKQGQFLPPTLPSMTSLTLLACHTHLLAGDVKEAENVLSAFPMTNQANALDPNEAYCHILGLWYRSLIHSTKREMEDASSVTMECLQILIQIQEKTDELSEGINLKLLELKKMLFNNCAVFAIGNGNFRYAHSLLTTSISLTSDHDPITCYNYCLLLIRLGKTQDACRFWLEEIKQNTGLQDDSNYNLKMLTQYANTVLSRNLTVS